MSRHGDHRQDSDAPTPSQGEERRCLATGSPLDVVYEWDCRDGQIRWFGAIGALLGYDPGKQPRTLEAFLAHVHPDDRGRVEEVTRAGLATGSTWGGLYRVVRKDGGVAQWHGTGSPVLDATGNPVRVIGAISDVTARMRFEASLAEERALYLDLMNAQPAGTYRIRVASPARWRQDSWHNAEVPPFRFEHLSARFCELMGHDRESIEAQPGRILELVHPDDREAFARRNEEANRQLIPFLWEGRLLSGGRERWVRLESLPRPGEDGDVVWTGILVDVTAQRLAEDALRQREDQLRALSDNLPAGLVFQIESASDGSQRRFNYISARVEQLHGLTAAAVLADPATLHRQIHEEDQSRVAELEARAAAEMKPLCAEVRVRLPSGETCWRLFAAAPRRLPNERLLWDGIELDVTERRRDDEERAKLQAQLAQAQKIEAIGRLAGGVAHDFNNMLVVILANAELAQKQLESTSPLASHLEQIHRAAVHSAELTRQLLAFARKQTISPQVLDLNQTVEDTLRMLRRLLGEDIELSWRPGAGVGAVRMDPAQVEQILTNLCVNARDAISGAGAAGRITIETGRRRLAEDDRRAIGTVGPGDYAVLRVGDTGCGMDPASLEQLFEPFFTTKVLGRGTGLGLSTVHGIVTQNGGQIEVRSQRGCGTTFEILLPCHTLPAESEDAVGEPATGERGSERVLVVEDEPSVLRVTSILLDSLGYRVVAAAGPVEALRLAREHSDELDLLMTDLVMPEMNGRELARQVQGLHPRIRCLFVSGYTADVIAHRGILERGVHFLAKPFTRAELAAKVREVLGPSS